MTHRTPLALAKVFLALPLDNLERVERVRAVFDVVVVIVVVAVLSENLVAVEKRLLFCIKISFLCTVKMQNSCHFEFTGPDCFLRSLSDRWPTTTSPFREIPSAQEVRLVLGTGRTSLKTHLTP